MSDTLCESDVLSPSSASDIDQVQWAEHAIPDVQNTPDRRNIDIDKVGIRGIRHPVKIRDKSGDIQHTIATFGMYVYLPHHFKGTHMSRFVQILNTQNNVISAKSFKDILNRMLQSLDAQSGFGQRLHIGDRNAVFIFYK